MKFYRKNIGSAHRAIRIVLGIVVMIAAAVRAGGSLGHALLTLRLFEQHQSTDATL